MSHDNDAGAVLREARPYGTTPEDSEKLARREPIQDGRSVLTYSEAVAYDDGYQAALAQPQAAGADDRPRWRHKVRGVVCREIGRAKLQVSTMWPVEGSVLVIYEHDEKLWAREEIEFEDGRFERLPAPPRATQDGEDLT